MAKIADGSSNTLLYGEKRLRPSQYETGASWDNRGWSDGWDWDLIRSTMFPFDQDSESPSPDGATSAERQAAAEYGRSFGSAHSGGMNAAFADGSTRSIEYDISTEVLNQLGNRADGEVVDTSELN